MHPVPFHRPLPKTIHASRIRAYERSKNSLEALRRLLRSLELQIREVEEENRLEGDEIAAALRAGARITEE
jgi:hypothetical protein